MSVTHVYRPAALGAFGKRTRRCELAAIEPRGAVSRVPPSGPPSQNQVGGVCSGEVVTQFFDIENKGDVVRLGLNHRFGDRREVVPLK